MGTAGQTTETGERGIRILGLPGSVEPDCLNVHLLEATAELLPDGVALTVLPPQAIGLLPPYAPGAPATEDVARLRESVAAADAVLLATPEYNGSIPGGLKNAIDWATEPQRDGPIRGKPAAVIGADRSDAGCDWAHADARKVLEVAGARVVRDGLAIRNAGGDGDGAPALGDEERAALGEVLGELVAEASLPA